MRNYSINYVELPAANLEAVKEFFAATFGWTFQDFGPDYCSFDDGVFHGGLYKSDKVARIESGSALVVIYAEDLEGAANAVQSNSGQIVKEIFSFPGGRRFHFTDPHGNEFAVWSDK